MNNIPSINNCKMNNDIIILKFESISQRDEKLSGEYQFSSTGYTVAYSNGKVTKDESKIISYSIKTTEEITILSIEQILEKKLNRLQKNPSPLLAKLGLMSEDSNHGFEKRDILQIVSHDDVEKIRKYFSKLNIDEKE